MKRKEDKKINEDQKVLQWSSHNMSRLKRPKQAKGKAQIKVKAAPEDMEERQSCPALF